MTSSTKKKGKVCLSSLAFLITFTDEFEATFANNQRNKQRRLIFGHSEVSIL